MPRVVHFEIPAEDPARAVEFYTKVFGWKITKWDGPMEYWLVMTSEEGEPGIDGGIMKREDPNQTAANTIGVPSVDEYVSRIEANGGKVVMPKTAVPGVGYLAYCVDTEGITFGIMEEDRSAK
jgi:predicted enzyme related to lactoylglutathione lyase